MLFAFVFGFCFVVVGGTISSMFAVTAADFSSVVVLVVK
jgi:hypothetical protein